MPNTVIKSETIGNYYIEFTIETRYDITFYRVASYYRGRTDIDNIYSIDNEKGAKACYRRYIRRAKADS